MTHLHFNGVGPSHAYLWSDVDGGSGAPYVVTAQRLSVETDVGISAYSLEAQETTLAGECRHGE